VAFATGGLPDLVTHRVSGWLAQPFSTDDFAQGLAHALATPELGLRARAEALERFAPALIAARYVGVYQRLAAAAGKPAEGAAAGQPGRAASS
jgi:glycosyltransferase involved in cell wall biosynthesis